MKKIFFPVCALMLPLAACTVGPDYQRPETPLPPTFGADAPPAGTPVAADWWRLFGDAELTRVVELAFDKSPTVARAAARIEEADGRLREVGGDALPSVNANAGASRARHSSRAGPPRSQGFVGGTYNDFSAGLSTSFELDFWGKLRRAKEGARADALASRAGAGVVRLTLAGKVAQSYFAVRSLEAQIKAQADTVEALRESQTLAHRRVADGATSSLDAAQTEAALAGGEAQKAALARALAVQKTQLALLCGMPDLRLADAATDIQTPPATPAGLPADIVRARPDVHQAEEAYHAANAAIGYRQAFKYPTFSLTGALGVESRDLSHIATRGASLWSVGAGVYAPILDWGKIDAQVDQTKARAKAAAADFEQTVQTAYAEIACALATQSGLAAEAAPQEARLRAAKEALSLAKKRYASGYSAYLEVLDAQRQANDAQQSVLRLKESQQGAAVDLFKALGGGWKASEAK